MVKIQIQRDDSQPVTPSERSKSNRPDVSTVQRKPARLDVPDGATADTHTRRMAGSAEGLTNRKDTVRNQGGTESAERHVSVTETPRMARGDRDKEQSRFFQRIIAFERERMSKKLLNPQTPEGSKQDVLVIVEADRLSRNLVHLASGSG